MPACSATTKLQSLWMSDKLLSCTHANPHTYVVLTDVEDAPASRAPGSGLRGPTQGPLTEEEIEKRMEIYRVRGILHESERVFASVSSEISGFLSSLAHEFCDWYNLSCVLLT